MSHPSRGRGSGEILARARHFADHSPMILSPQCSSVACLAARLSVLAVLAPVLAACPTQKKEIPASAGGSTGTTGAGTGGAVSGGAGGAAGMGGADTGGVAGTSAANTGGAPAAIGGAPGAGGGSGNGGARVPGGGGAGGQLSQSRKLDLLFMVDDSMSMSPLQAKMVARLPDFMNALRDSSTGALPDLHVAVITSSLGAGAFVDVPGCAPGAPGNAGGKFQHKDGCGLLDGETYIKAPDDGSMNNFTGQIQEVFGCIALVGDRGCGFEHPFESVRQALIKSTSPTDRDNGGFLRDDALLGIVMLTNEDDCSAPADSQLFNPNISSVNDLPPLGGLWSYRCNEFGHKCDQPMPHTAVGLPMTLTGCMSREDSASDNPYRLTPVAEFVSFLGQIKARDRLFVAVIGGPYDDATAPYVVYPRVAQLDTGGTEMQPDTGHSCVQATGEYADPGVRLLKLVTDLNGVFLPICASDFRPAMVAIARALINRMGAN
jgi:hypothetical protein